MVADRQAIMLFDAFFCVCARVWCARMSCVTLCGILRAIMFDRVWCARVWRARVSCVCETITCLIRQVPSLVVNVIRFSGKS